MTKVGSASYNYESTINMQIIKKNGRITVLTLKTQMPSLKAYDLLYIAFGT